MSDLGFLEKLLDGAEVEWMPLGDLEDASFVKLGRGSVISKNDLAATPGDFPVYSSSASDQGEFGRYGNYMFDDERITWSIDGGGRFFYRSPHKYSVTNVCGWLTVLEHKKLSTRYLYHYLSAAWANKVFDYTKKAHPSVIRKEYSVPIPCPEEPEKSLAIQGEIVRILDRFTELTAELITELGLRRKQYNHYRDQLLNFEDGEVEWKALGDLTRIKTGQSVNKRMIAENPGEFPVINSGRDPLGFLDDWNTEDDPIGITSRGAGVGSVTWQEGRYYRGNLNYSVTINSKEELDLHYLYHVLEQFQPQIKALCTFDGIPALNAVNLKKLNIPVPPFEEQARIAKTLDTFDTLTTSLSEGLPREIALRQQQYEYYRDLLLSFPEPAEAVEA